MKKLFMFMLILATTSSILSIPIFAEEISEEENVIESELKETKEIEPRASLYFSSYTYDLEPSSRNGYLDFSSLVVITNRTDEVRVSVQIQQYTPGEGWSDYGDKQSETSSRAAFPFEGTVKVDRGEEYRAKFYYDAIVNDKVVETKIFATSSVLAP
ncbi:hypothetical protein AAK894_09675 [Lachnospiraceae bacterium 46-61]